jgi:hypothetical protein
MLAGSLVCPDVSASCTISGCPMHSFAFAIQNNYSSWADQFGTDRALLSVKAMQISLGPSACSTVEAAPSCRTSKTWTPKSCTCMNPPVAAPCLRLQPRHSATQLDFSATLQIPPSLWVSRRTILGPTRLTPGRQPCCHPSLGFDTHERPADRAPRRRRSAMRVEDNLP